MSRQSHLPYWGIPLLLCFVALPTRLGARDSASGQVQIDTTTVVNLPTVLVRSSYRTRPLSSEERSAYWRRIRDVKKTLPYAKYVAVTIIETYEYMETLDTDEEREAHLKRVEQDLKAEMEPKMRDLTLRQGQLLIKLINRQCGQTSYELVKAFLGGWRAWWWNAFAKVIGANLKSPYNPKEVEDDAVTERIIRLVEMGLL
ncbi:MAG: DUF4294 domain-containing protein [Porphyromonadaceae bacterium]|nr:DUF4294 domain-containing protein [Porphyromonadaceae bacterium]